MFPENVFVSSIDQISPIKSNRPIFRLWMTNTYINNKIKKISVIHTKQKKHKNINHQTVGLYPNRYQLIKKFFCTVVIKVRKNF